MSKGRRWRPGLNCGRLPRPRLRLLHLIAMSCEDAVPSVNTNYSKSWVKGRLGIIPILYSANESEVWKAGRRDSKQLFALKKILMHNEKEGV